MEEKVLLLMYTYGSMCQSQMSEVLKHWYGMALREKNKIRLTTSSSILKYIVPF